MKIMNKLASISIDLIEFIRQDCLTNGHGRQKWWADRLGVSQMMVSHWLNERRKPSALHLNDIYRLNEQIKAEREKGDWLNHLWCAYYFDADFLSPVIRSIAIRLLTAEGLPVRALALLSWFFERFVTEPQPEHEVPIAPLWRNRLGWLYESSGLNPGYQPKELQETGALLEISKSGVIKGPFIHKYLKSKQTDLGRKWQVYDCSLDEIKEQISWRNNPPQNKSKLLIS